MRAGRPSPRLVGPALAAALLVAWCAVQVATGTSWGDLAGWLAAVTLGVLLPGTAVVRAVRRAPAPLVDDLAYGAAAGVGVALAGWLLDRLLPWSPGPLVVGPVVTLVLLVPPALRRRLLARPSPGWGPGASLAAAACMAAALVWMTTTCLSWLPSDPGSGPGVLYSQDTLFQSALVGELGHHLAPEYPMVAGEPLRYHWFLYAVLAHLTTGTGVDPFATSLRLGPTTVLPGVLLLAGVVARSIAGRTAAAPVAMALLAVTDLTLATRWGWRGSSAVGGAYSPVIGFWRGSPPQELAWLAGLAALGTTVAWLRRDEAARTVPVLLLPVFFWLCLGAKSSQLPVLAAGVGLALAVAAVQRRWGVVARAAVLLVLAAGLAVLATVIVYRGGSYGLIWQPGGRVRLAVGELFPALAGRAVPWVAGLTAVLVGTLPLLPRLLGLLWLGARRRDDPATWVTAGCAVAGFAAVYLLRHPAQSELYFLVGAYPLAVVGSAAGLTLAAVAAARRLGLGRAAAVTALAACAALGALAAAGVAWSLPASWPVDRWAAAHPGDPTAALASVAQQAKWYLGPWGRLVVGLARAVGIAVVLGAVVAAVRVRGLPRGRGGWAAGVAAALVAVVVGSGAYGASQAVGGTGDGTFAARMDRIAAQAPADGVLPTTGSVRAAGRWLDRRAGRDDVVAVNRVCVETRAWRAGRARCDAREFSPAAFGQRRSYVGGWAYADRNLEVAWDNPPPYRKIDFWDPPRYAREEAAFESPTPELLSELHADGVRWLWADLRDGPVDTAGLDRLAQPGYSGVVRIWRLRAPAASGSASSAERRSITTAGRAGGSVAPIAR